jgi:hypothetical protein
MFQPDEETIMTTIGGKHRKANLPTQPQVVVQIAAHLNQYAKFGMDDKQRATIAWVGDPDAATKFNSKYEAKSRTRDMADIPETRVFHVMEKSL